MIYVTVPKELSLAEIRASSACMSPGRYNRFSITKAGGESRFEPLDQLVVLRETRVAVRPNAKYRYAEIGDIDVDNGSVVFRRLPGYQVPTRRPQMVKKGDVLMSTVRTYRKGIGLVAEPGDDLVATNALMNICAVKPTEPRITLEYLFAFLRTHFFTEQVWSMLNRGLYPRMDRGALDKVVIPIPSDERAIKYVSALVQTIIEKERTIRERAAAIQDTIQTELEKGQSGKPFVFEFPSASRVQALGRFDASIYDKEYSSKIWLVENYGRGWVTPKEAGFSVTPGPSLEIKIIGTRIDADQPKPGFYALILPTNISPYGTMNAIPYLGTAKRLPLLQEGDIIFGEAGFQKGRSIVLVEGIPNCTTNAHGLYARRADGDVAESVFFRCVFNWYRSMRLIDLMAVGGSGGHFSPEYFEYLRIPRFPDDVKSAVVELYHHDGPAPGAELGLENFVDWHREWNARLGIWQLDREMKKLQRDLTTLQEEIISGRRAEIPL